MSGPAQVLLLVAAGVGAGLTGSVAGLASLSSYPALLAVGLSPVVANVTNAVALTFSSAGSVLGSGPELTGQAQRARPLALAGLAGGVAGAALLLLTPAAAFGRAVPLLVALGSLAVLLPRRRVTQVHRRHHAAVLAGTALTGAYGGYFGAGAGVLMLALFLNVSDDPLPRANALKNLVLGVANGVAAAVYLVVAPVDLAAATPLALGCLAGARLGPVVVRHAPVWPLRVVVAAAGLALAVVLASR